MSDDDTARPRFRSHLLVRWTDDDAITIHQEAGTERFESTLLRRLAPLIDGRRTVSQISQQLSPEPAPELTPEPAPELTPEPAPELTPEPAPELTPEPAPELTPEPAPELTPLDVVFGIDWFEQQGYVVQSPDPAEDGAARFAEALGGDVEQMAALARRPLSWWRLSDVDTEPLAAALRQSGVQFAMRADRRLVIVDDIADPRLAEVQRQSLADGFAWLLIQPAGLQPIVGPLFEPDRAGCWSCLEARLRAWRPVRVPVPRSATSSLMAFGLAAGEVVKWLLLGAEALRSRLLSCDVLAHETTVHTLVPRPHCAHCGTQAVAPLAQAGEAEVAAPDVRPKVFQPGGASRVASAAATWAKYQYLISPLIGLVDSVQPYYEESDDLVHVFKARHALPDPTSELAASQPLPGNCAGRGMTPGPARAAALCEALERYSGFYQGHEAQRRARLRDFEGAAIHPNECLRIGEWQFAEREAWNARGLPFHWLPEPFDETQSVDWTAFRCLTSDRQAWLPTAYCYFGYPATEGPKFSRADSNGCAAGSCFEEAVLYGFLELVERDALALWWYNRAQRPGIRLAGVEDARADPYARALMRRFAELGRDLWVLDITTDLGIPTFVALSRPSRESAEPREGGLILGAGCHLDPRQALLSALTEANQFLPAFLAGRPRQVVDHDPGREAPFLLPDPAVEPLTIGQLPDGSSDDLAEDVEACLKAARRCRLEVFVLDQTRTEVGLPVARVVVPGLRLFRARFAPGRLFDVPVKLGWQTKALTVEQLNSAHILI